MESLIWGFFIAHVSIFAITSIFLLIINLVGNPWVFWFFWPFLIWSLVIAGHYYLNKLILQGYFIRLKTRFMQWILKL